MGGLLKNLFWRTLRAFKINLNNKCPLLSENKVTKEKKFMISEKNPWLYPKDNFGKLEEGIAYK